MQYRVKKSKENIMSYLYIFFMAVRREERI